MERGGHLAYSRIKDIFGEDAYREAIGKLGQKLNEWHRRALRNTEWEIADDDIFDY